jgi:hypothetical protein
MLKTNHSLLNDKKALLGAMAVIPTVQIRAEIFIVVLVSWL